MTLSLHTCNRSSRETQRERGGVCVFVITIWGLYHYPGQGISANIIILVSNYLSILGRLTFVCISDSHNFGSIIVKVSAASKR